MSQAYCKSCRRYLPRWDDNKGRAFLVWGGGYHNSITADSPAEAARWFLGSTTDGCYGEADECFVVLQHNPTKVYRFKTVSTFDVEEH